VPGTLRLKAEAGLTKRQSGPGIRTRPTRVLEVPPASADRRPLGQLIAGRGAATIADRGRPDNHQVGKICWAGSGRPLNIPPAHYIGLADVFRGQAVNLNPKVPCK